MRNLPTLHRLWPTARFVHLIRDGRDVFLSMINWKRANRAVGRCLDPRSGLGLGLLVEVARQAGP